MGQLVSGRLPTSLARLHRTVMMTPGSDARLVEKAAAARVDACVLDLEDGVHPDARERARATVGEAMAGLDWGPKTRGVRVHPPSHPDGADDIRAAVAGNPNFIMIAKATADDVLEADELLSTLGADDVRLWAMIESCAGVEQVSEIASPTRMEGLAFGGGDYSADLGVREQSLSRRSELPGWGRQPELAYARSRMVTAARLRGLVAVDSAASDVRREDEIRSATLQALQFGFDGCFVYSPRQAAVVHDAWRPTEDMVAWASEVRRKFEAAAADAETVVTVDGEMVDGPFVRTATQILDRVERLAAWEAAFAQSGP